MKLRYLKALRIRPVVAPPPWDHRHAGGRGGQWCLGFSFPVSEVFSLVGVAVSGVTGSSKVRV